MKATHKAYLAASLYACTIGFSFLFVKLALKSAGPLELLAHRFLVASVVAVAPVALKMVKLNLTVKDFISILPLALFYPVSFFLLQTVGLMFIPSSEAGMIQAAAPVFTLLLAYILLKERTDKKQIPFVLLSVGGVLFVSVMKGIGAGDYDLRGIALMLAATVSMSMYAVLARKLTKRFPVYTLTCVMSVTGFLVFSIVSLVNQAVAGTLFEFFTPFADFSYVLAILFLGGISSFLSAFLSNYGFSVLPAYKMSVFSNLATVIAIVAGAVFLGESLYWYHLVGGAVIVAGVFGSNRFA